MDANQIGVFLEAGVPTGTTVIHKHGWINDTHGDAGLVIGPNGAYVFVVALYGRDWLEFDTSSVIIAELARMTWNTLNPTQPARRDTLRRRARRVRSAQRPGDEYAHERVTCPCRDRKTSCPIFL